MRKINRKKKIKKERGKSLEHQKYERERFRESQKKLVKRERESKRG